MKAKIDSKHRLLIPKSVWAECNFSESSFVELRLDECGNIIVSDASNIMQRIKHVDGLRTRKGSMTADERCKEISREFCCIARPISTTGDIVLFDAFCMKDVAEELKRRFRKEVI